MDLDDSVQMTFQFKSFLFAKMQGYEAARTWEVSIPLTSRNRAIIQQSQSADSSSAFPYTTHTVSMYSDGYPLVENGRAYMLGTGSGRARFVFVLGETIKALKELGEKKLNELTEESTDYLNWNNSVSLNNMSAGFGWCNFFSFTNQDRSVTGSNSNLPYSTLHPVVTLNYLMNKIQAFFGLTVVGFGSLLNGCGFPLSDFEKISTLSSGETSTANAPSGFAGAGSYVAFENFLSDFFEIIDNKYIISYNKKSVQIHITNFRAAYTTATGTVTLKITDSSGNTRIVAVAEESLSGSITRYDFVDYTFDFDATDSFFFFEKTGTGSYAGSTFKFEVVSSAAFYSNINSGGFYPIIPNLPDLTCAEFINQCCMLTGLFPYVDSSTPTTVNFYSVADMFTNKAVAQNWSKYMLKESDHMSEGEDIEYILDGFSQRNTLNFAKDELNQLDTSGLITASNTNLEYESELFRLYFAAGRRASISNTIVDYPLYDVSIVDGVLVRNKTNQSLPIIAKIENIDSINYLTFPDELKFSAIKTARYSEYQTLVAQPRIIKEKFRLTARLTSAIDVRIPICLEQYGQYYAILEAQITDTYEADVTLLEIK